METVITVVWLVLSGLAVPFATWGFVEACKDYSALMGLAISDVRKTARAQRVVKNARRRSFVLMMIQYSDIGIGLGVLILDPDSALRILIARSCLMFDKVLLVALVYEQFKWRRYMRDHD